MTCRARMNSGSTDLSSDSVDIEELSDSDSSSDSDSTDTESDEDTPANQFNSSSGADQLPAQLHKAADPIRRSASANVVNLSKKQYPHRDRRSSEGGTKTKGGLATSTKKYSSPTKTHKSRLDSNKKASNAGTSGNKASDLYGFTTNDANSGGLLYPGIGGYGMAFDGSTIVEYSDSDSDDSDYNDDEEGVDVSPSEMTRLLSLNDQDMYENEESDEEGEGEEEGEGLQFRGQGEDRGNGVKKTRHGEITKQGTKSTYMYIYIVHICTCTLIVSSVCANSGVHVHCVCRRLVQCTGRYLFG